MQFRQTNILELFVNPKKFFVIPVYQRAYSWEIEHWNTFLKDLKEQILGDNNYYYGNILLETVKKGIEYEVIDGQQRLTTISIFFRAIIDVLRKRSKTESIEMDFDDKLKTYIKNGGNIKLRTVEYDRACYSSIIVDGEKKFSTATPSQERILKARNHFKKELKKLSTNDLLKIFDKIEETELTCIELKGKKDSALMFELQNNRGKDLTNMEKLKSYFMYQMYVYSPEEETETNVEYVSNIFKLLYLIINDLKKLDEDKILLYHCNAYVKGYNYRSIDDIKEVFSKSENKVKWIKEFINELHTSFSNMKKMESSNLHYLNDLRQLSIPAFVYPFVIKGYKFFGESDVHLNTLYHILEVLVFRDRLINSRADLISRLNDLLNDFDGNLNDLRNNFDKKMNDAWYWNEDRVEEYLEKNMYKNSVVHYLLWKYEDYIQNNGYEISNAKIKKIQIEHISPQTPTDDTAIASGYEVTKDNDYDDEFKEEYLNSIGNLMLISGSHNSSIGNKPFKDKLESYNSNPLLNQQAEIKKFAIGNTWTKESIDERYNSIVDEFALKKWSFKAVEIEADAIAT